MMTSQDDENAAPVTALVIAATNPKRDGTEMVRILLSKGANPEEISTAGVDEKSLGLGMRYWLDKARRIGVPSQTKLAHMKKTPPMHHLHELDYAVVGEEAAVNVIQQALAGRFGNPQGNRKPLVMLLLGPPGETFNIIQTCDRVASHKISVCITDKVMARPTFRPMQLVHS